jgi:hypothetical protein
MPDRLLRTFAKSIRHKEPAALTEAAHVEIMMTSKTDPGAQSQRKRDQEIDRRYGAIGIAAVAAAARYHSASKAEPPAPAAPPRENDRAERAA